MEHADKPEVKSASTLRRGIAVLRELSVRYDPRSGKGVPAASVARALGCDRSQALRTLTVLCELGFAERAESGRGFRPTWALYGLGVRSANLEMVTSAMPVLDTLAAQCRLGCYFTVRDSQSVMPIWASVAPGADVPIARPGTRWSRYASAAGIAHLVDHTREEFDREMSDIELVRYTQWTPHDVDAVWKLVCDTRLRGYAIQDKHWDDELFAIGVPVRDARRQIVGAIAVSGPPEAFTGRVESVARLAVGAARTVGARSASPAEAPRIEPRWVRNLG